MLELMGFNSEILDIFVEAQGMGNCATRVPEGFQEELPEVEQGVCEDDAEGSAPYLYTCSDESDEEEASPIAFPESQGFLTGRKLWQNPGQFSYPIPSEQPCEALNARTRVVRRRKRAEARETLARLTAYLNDEK